LSPYQGLFDAKNQCHFFAESLLSLTDRLTGPFNVEQTVLQLDISISDAIMNFQDSGFKVITPFHESQDQESTNIYVMLSLHSYNTNKFLLYICLKEIFFVLCM
jgi:hypothetical protein